MRAEIPTFPRRLKELRAARDMSQVRLAEAAGTHPDSVVKFEQGKRMPSLELAWRLATALGVTLNDLVPTRWHPQVAPGGYKSRSSGG